MPRNFIRTILFDFGGTLMYGRRNWVPVVAKADDALTNQIRSQGMDVSINTFSTEFRRRLNEYFKQREKDLLETTYSFVLPLNLCFQVLVMCTFFCNSFRQNQDRILPKKINT